MDLLALSRTLWRHKIAVIPVLVLVLAGLIYVVKIKPPTYDADGELALLSPPAAPTAAQIQADPAKYSKIDANNPYLDYGDLTYVGDAVMDRVTSHSAQQALAAEGVSPKYQVAMSSDPGNPAFLDITGVGTTSAEAIYAAQKVMTAATNALTQIQLNVSPPVSPQYMITMEPLLTPTSAQQEVTSKLRALIEVLGVGVILLFLVISIAEAFARRREEELDIPPARPRRSFQFREEPNGLDASEATQEFARPFLSSGARRAVHLLSEGRSALPAMGRGRDANLGLDEDGEDADLGLDEDGEEAGY
jgi:hypothetical protein